MTSLIDDGRTELYFLYLVLGGALSLALGRALFRSVTRDLGSTLHPRCAGLIRFHAVAYALLCAGYLSVTVRTSGSFHRFQQLVEWLTNRIGFLMLFLGLLMLVQLLSLGRALNGSALAVRDDRTPGR